MAKMTFSKLCSQFNLKLNSGYTDLKANGETILQVRNYLPVNDKADFLQFIVNNAVDDSTGCFSPLRVEVYFGLAVCKWYGGITFTDKQLQDAGKTYDILDSNNMIDDILDCVDQHEKEFIMSLVDDTVKDIARYNSSAAGIIQNMSNNAGELDSQLADILNKVKNAEGLENLKAITDVVGTD